MYVDQHLRRLLRRYCGKIEFDYTCSHAVCRLRAKRDGGSVGDWVYVSFSLPGAAVDDYDLAVAALRRWLTMPQAQFDKEYPKDSD